jgi:diaminopimelate decarboxylase
MQKREEIKALYLANPFLTGVMCHVGSQGMSLSSMVEGAKRVIELAAEIDLVCGCQRICFIDIGGGLPVDYSSDEICPPYKQ